jgi:hypothetical protein
VENVAEIWIMQLQLLAMEEQVMEQSNGYCKSL